MISALIGQCKGWTIRKVVRERRPRKISIKKCIYFYRFCTPPQKKKKLKIKDKDKNKNMHMEDLYR